MIIAKPPFFAQHKNSARSAHPPPYFVVDAVSSLPSPARAPSLCTQKRSTKPTRALPTHLPILLWVLPFVATILALSCSCHSPLARQKFSCIRLVGKGVRWLITASWHLLLCEALRTCARSAHGATPQSEECYPENKKAPPSGCSNQPGIYARIASLMNLPLLGCCCSRSQLSRSQRKLNILCPRCPRGEYALRTRSLSSIFFVM